MTQITLSLSRILQSKWFHLTTSIPPVLNVKELVELAGGDEYRIDLDAELAKQGEIAIIWSILDVQELRPDLSDDQAWEVLEQCKDVHDAEWGFTFTHIQTVADDMFPRPSTSDTV